ncbi:major tail V domain protein [Escherichia coli]|nr:major tail V domain protein [Escherichia coli]
MPVPNPTMPVKGAGTTLWVYKGNGDPYANRFQTLTGRVWQKLKT